MLHLSREEILSHRLRASHLAERLPRSRRSLERAAFAGLQDSMPRAALLSIHARVAGTHPMTWSEPPLVQVWGPRYSAFVICGPDRAVFTLGRLPQESRAKTRAQEMADRLEAALDGQRLDVREAARRVGVHPNALRYAAPTGRFLISWDGARQPLIWRVLAPAVDPTDARLELGRRHLHVFGPATPEAFAQWAGIRPREARGTFDGLRPELVPVRAPHGEGWILSSDEKSFREESGVASTRLLPSGDTYFLLQGTDRELLVPESSNRPRLWTPRVWPGAVVVNGEIAGTWRRAQHNVAVQFWRRLSAGERAAVEEEACSFPLPGLDRPITVTWEE